MAPSLSALRQRSPALHTATGLAVLLASAFAASSAHGQGSRNPVAFHLNRAMDNGLTQAQAAEVLTHIAFYAGWPSAFSALQVVKDVFERRNSH